jgi:predicted nucleic acid-binding protein
VPNQIVVDASVAAKWFLTDASEADTDLAEEVLLAILAGDLEAHGPGIFEHEVCGLLTKAIGSGRLTKDVATDCATAFFEIPITAHPETEDQKLVAMELAADHSKTFYDMTYVRLANELACRWCTADRKFLKAVPVGLTAHVEPLDSLR